MNWKQCCVLSWILLTGHAVCADTAFVIRSVDTDKRVVALTFDDGPTRYTDDILDILTLYNAKATFFLIGSQLKRYPNYVQRIKVDGHSIGNHSYDHRHVMVQSEADLLKNIARSQLLFYDVLSMLPIYYRPPYGEITPAQEAILKKHFSYLIRWGIDPKDWDRKRSKDDIVTHIVTSLKPGVIIVLHERKQTVKFLPELILAIQQKGYQLVSLDYLTNNS
ncbi:hypothetical protein CL658_03460 [bacterium]|nr:hypothetical protein [bacterium]